MSYDDSIGVKPAGYFNDYFKKHFSGEFFCEPERYKRDRAGGYLDDYVNQSGGGEDRPRTRHEIIPDPDISPVTSTRGVNALESADSREFKKQIFDSLCKDETDIKILENLLLEKGIFKDGSINKSEMGRIIGMTDKAIEKRWKKIQKKAEDYPLLKNYFSK